MSPLQRVASGEWLGTYEVPSENAARIWRAMSSGKSGGLSIHRRKALLSASDLMRDLPSSHVTEGRRLLRVSRQAASYLYRLSLALRLACGEQIVESIQGMK